MYATRRAVEIAQEQRLSFLELKERESLNIKYDPTSGIIEVSNKGPVEVVMTRIWVFRSTGVQVIELDPNDPTNRLAPGEPAVSYTINPTDVESVAIETARGKIFIVKTAVLQAAIPVVLYNMVVPSTES